MNHLKNRRIVKSPKKMCCTQKKRYQAGYRTQSNKLIFAEDYQAGYRTLSSKPIFAERISIVIEALGLEQDDQWFYSIRIPDGRVTSYGLGRQQTRNNRLIWNQKGVYSIRFGGTDVSDVQFRVIINSVVVGTTTGTSQVKVLNVRFPFESVGGGVTADEVRDVVSSIIPQEVTTPRYRIVSPVENGYYTDTVRSATPREVSRLRTRGYRVDQVSSNTPITPTIRVREGHSVQREVSRKPRMGLGTRMADMQRRKGLSLYSFRPKSRHNPRSSFAEKMIYYSSLRKKYYNLTPQTAATLNSRNNWGLTKVSVTIQQVLQQPGKLKRVNAGEPIIINDDRGNPNTVTTPRYDDTAVRNRIAQLERELRELNSRASVQLTNLGVSTQDRTNEINALRSTVNEVNERVSSQLVELGNTANELSAAIKAQNIQREIDNAANELNKIGTGGGDILGGITGFFGNPSNLMLIVLLIIGIVILKK